MLQDILDQIIAILITGDVDQRNARTIMATFANSIKVTTKKVNSTNLKTLLDNLRRELIHAIFRSISDNMVNCSATISWCSMFADMLNTPIAKLTMGNDVDTSEDFLNARTLWYS